MRTHSAVGCARVGSSPSFHGVEDNDAICNEAVAMKYYDSVIRELNGELG